jgi:hypothetical protein
VLDVAVDARAAQQQVVAPQVREQQTPTAVVEAEQNRHVDPAKDATEDESQDQRSAPGSAEEIEEVSEEQVTHLSPAEMAERERNRLRFEDSLSKSLLPQPGDKAALATQAAAAVAHASKAISAYAGPAEPAALDSEI